VTRTKVNLVVLTILMISVPSSLALGDDDQDEFCVFSNLSISNDDELHLEVYDGCGELYSYSIITINNSSGPTVPSYYTAVEIDNGSFSIDLSNYSDGNYEAFSSSYDVDGNMLASSSFSFTLGLDPGSRICTVLVDWDQEWEWGESGELLPTLLHRYRVSFNPPLSNGSSPTSVNATVEHIRGELDLATENLSIFAAGGEIDLILPEEPQFGDYISISINSDQAVCSRSLNITNWNQPISDHEVTRETLWSISGMEDGQGISFEGRGWQKRTGSVLESNELGNGTLSLDMTNGSTGAIIDLELDRIWLNETYEGTQLLAQDFEMTGSGKLLIETGDEGENVVIDAVIEDAYVLRSFAEGKITERMRFEGDGWLSLNEGDNESSEGVFGEVFLLYFEIWDENGFRRLQDLQVEANATARLSAAGEYFSFELDELILREKWEEGIRTDQYSRIFGGGNFDFVASEENPYIEVNGTIPVLHLQSEGGETVANTLVVDGTYDGDAQGTFGLVRQIVESGVFHNATGEPFEADKIRNEFWLNISTTPFGPIDQEWGAEHNLTYEYVVPQEDWLNRTIRLTYVEDNGTEDEYPENSPVISNPEPPEANPIFSDHISRETGVCPQIVSIGDSFSLAGNQEMILDVSVIGISSEIVDGHSIMVANWIGNFGDMSSANGSVINEGPLSGLLNEVSRIVSIGLGGGEESVTFLENQRVDRIMSPSIVTFDENTPPSLSSIMGSSVRFREGILTTEGGIAFLEVLVDDVDTDISGVSIDLSAIGLGIVELSDSGLLGDLVIHDDIWSARIVHDGLEHGSIPVTVYMQDYWVTVEEASSIEVTNAPPRIVQLEFSPEQTLRGETIEVTVGAFDGHGVKSVSVNLLGIGGENVPLQFVGELDWEWQHEGKVKKTKIESWSGFFEIPSSISPGRQNIPILLEDFDGASVSSKSTGSILTSIPGKSAKKILIANLPPSIGNLTILSEGEVVESVTSPSSGVKNYTMEVSIEDLDGISSAQAKLGRLAPIGQSESWMLLVDDGTGADRVSGDGVFSISFSARSSLSEGEISVLIRATDVFLSTTNVEDQGHSITISKSISDSVSTSWIEENSTLIILSSIVALLALGVGTLVMIVRNSDIE